MKLQGTVLSIGIMAGIVGMSPSSSAVGERWITHSGNICQPYIAGSAAWITSPSLMETGIYGIDLGNTTLSGTVWCPLPNVRDIAMTYDPWQVNMSVYDRSDTADFSCTLYRQDISSGNVVWSQTQTTTGSGTFQQYMNWALPVTTSRYHYAMQCVMPGYGTLGYSHLTSFSMMYPPL